MMLFTPGPVAVDPKIAQAQAGEMITHRGKQYQALYKPIIEELKGMLGAPEVHVMTGSGTLGVEANVQNALPAGGKALVLSNGAFGDKLKEHCQLYYETTFVRLKDAQGWDLERAKAHIDQAAKKGVKLLAMVHHETSPGILNKVREICQYAKGKGMLTLLDGTSAWPAYALNHADDSVDFYSWASQKALGCPPGLAVVSHSPDGAKAIEAAPVRSNFMNLKSYRKMAGKYENPTTPAVSIIYSLRVALDRLKKEGQPAFIARHAKMAAHVRARLVRMGFKLVSEPGFESSTVTAFFCQKNKEVNARLQTEYGVKLGGGHADWADTTLRFCNMGDVDMERIDKGLDALETVRAELGLGAPTAGGPPGEVKKERGA